ncbi:MAG: energy transducer TonB [Prevotella sp.]|jgi:protein TonB
MEIKKAERADLERRRTEGFLLGLIFALALLFTGLEFTTSPPHSTPPEELLEDMAEDMELLPAVDMEDMISTVSAPASKSLTENVKEAEIPVEPIDKIEPVTSKLVIDEGEGMAKDADITEALPQTKAENEDEVKRVVEQLPEFPGGMVEFMRWLSQNLHYPIIAQKRGIEGKVVVTFIVNKDGTIANPKVEKSANKYLDNEAMRVIKMMPKWKPGMIGKKPCRTMFAIPINFKI